MNLIVDGCFIITVFFYSSPGILRESIALLQYPPVNIINSKTAARNFLTEPDNITAKYDHLISLGSVQQTDSVHQLFVAAKQFNMTTTPSGTL